MTTPGVVEPLDVIKDICPGSVPGLVPGAKHSFNLQSREEALHRRIVPALSASAHAAGNSLISQQALEVLTGVLGVFNRSSQHCVGDWILNIHLKLRLVSSSRVFFGVWCSAHWRRRGYPGRSIGTGRYPWGSIAVEGHSCFRSCRAAMGYEGRRRRWR